MPEGRHEIDPLPYLTRERDACLQRSRSARSHSLRVQWEAAAAGLTKAIQIVRTMDAIQEMRRDESY